MAAREADLFEAGPRGSVKCTACRHYCLVAEGRSGACGVRRNEGGRLKLLVYGKAAAVHVDPIEKKPLFHFLPGARVFSLGTLGCNFACSFCQNWDISQAARNVSAYAKMPGALAIGEVSAFGQHLPPEEIVAYCVEHGVPVIAFTYNEPVIFAEYARDTARLARKKGIRAVFVSNGYESPEAVRYLKGVIDAINIDVKAFSDAFYRKVCGARLEPVLEGVKAWKKAGAWVEATTLVIPGKNDADDELEGIASFLAGVDRDLPWHVTAFHPDYQMRGVPCTPLEALQRAAAIGKEAGLRFVYAGNVRAPGLESTFCPSCGALLVEREGYRVRVAQGFEGGACGGCGERIPGVWA